MNEIQKEIAEQINWRELHMANFHLMTEAENIVHVKKGNKYVVIELMPNDTYKLRIGSYNRRTLELNEKVEEEVYAEQLQPMIQEHFPGFEYVMDKLGIRAGRPCVHPIVNVTGGQNVCMVCKMVVEVRA